MKILFRLIGIILPIILFSMSFCHAANFSKTGIVWAYNCDQGIQVRSFVANNSGDLAYIVFATPDIPVNFRLTRFIESGDQITFSMTNLANNDLNSARVSLVNGIWQLLDYSRNGVDEVENKIYIKSGNKAVELNQCGPTSRAYKLATSLYIDTNNFMRVSKGTSDPSAAEAQRMANDRKAAQLEEERRRFEEEKRQAALERQRMESQKAQTQVAPDNRRRLALVIGNDNYNSMPRLNNAVNDAKSMSEALRQANFEVMSYNNLDKRRMEEVLRNFTGKLGRDDVGLFYFSGHGIQADNRNFLIPVGENVKKTSEVPYEGVDVNRVMDNLKDAKNALNIVVLDACRSSLPDARGGMSRGLTVTDAPQGSIIAYATSPGKTASDGDSGNSPYTKNLIKAMQRKGVKIEDVFKEVRQSVIRDTNGEQTPSETSYLVGDFYFRP